MRPIAATLLQRARVRLALQLDVAGAICPTSRRLAVLNLRLRRVLLGGAAVAAGLAGLHSAYALQPCRTAQVCGRGQGGACLTG